MPWSERTSPRVLPFHSAVATACGDIVVVRRALGRPILEADRQTAAIGRNAGAPVAARNGADGEHCGISLVDPWIGRNALA